jgi:hypothetical protein
VISGSRPRKLATGAASALATLAMLPASALGGQSVSPPDEFSATDQYVESVPTSRGPNAPGVQKRRKASLPPAVGARIDREGGTSAAKLEQIATSPDLGAPPTQPARPNRKPGNARVDSSPSVSAAAVGALGEDEDGSLLGLIGALVLITGLAVGTAGYRYRKHKNAPG